MAIREGQVFKLAEGSGTLLALVEHVRRSAKKKGFDINIVEEGGLRLSAFDPSGEVIETSDAIMVNGREFGSKIPAKLLVFKSDQLNSEIGSLIIA